jgi:hypothetical protein
MKGKTFLTIALLVLCAALVLGCSEAEGRYTVGLQSAGSPQGTPGPGEGGVAVSGDEEAVVGSGGEVYTAPGASGGQGVVPGGGEGVIPGGPEPGEPEEVPVSQWKVYRNETYGYEIRHPSNYVILPEYILLKATEGQKPQPLHQVWFQDKKLAESETAAMEPPKFAITVFDNKAKRPIMQWLKEQGLLEGFQEVKAYTLAGVEGVRVRSMLLIGPNEFVYLAKGNYIYELTPFGRLAEEMLTTFKFIPGVELL